MSRRVRWPGGAEDTWFPESEDESDCEDYTSSDFLETETSGINTALGCSARGRLNDAELPQALTSLPPDICGACVLMHLHGHRENGCWEMFLAWFRVATVVAIQAFVVHSVHAYVDMDASYAYSKPPGMIARIEVLRNCKAGNIVLDLVEDSDIINLCWQMPNVVLWSLVLFLWSARILTEFHALYKFAELLLRVDDIPSGEIALRGPLKGALLIEGISRRDNLIFMMFIILPKSVLCVYLWIVGIEFLSSVPNMENIIIKMFSLKFIFDLDEVLFDSLVSTVVVQAVLRARVIDRTSKVEPAVSGFVRLLLTTSVPLVMYLLNVPLTQLRALCWSCSRDCDNPCSEAFDYCSRPHDLPLLGDQGWN